MFVWTAEKDERNHLVGTCHLAVPSRRSCRPTPTRPYDRSPGAVDQLNLTNSLMDAAEVLLNGEHGLSLSVLRTDHFWRLAKQPGLPCP